MDLERFCDEWFAAWTGTDAKALAAYYSEDCYYEDPAKPDGIQGRIPLERYLTKLLTGNPALVWKRERLYPVQGGFVVTYRARIPAGGEVITERGMDLVILDATGKISRNEVYFDMTQWRARLVQVAPAVTRVAD